MTYLPSQPMPIGATVRVIDPRSFYCGRIATIKNAFPCRNGETGYYVSVESATGNATIGFAVASNHVVDVRPSDIPLPAGWTWETVEEQRAKWDIADNMVPVAVAPGACVAWCTINAVRNDALMAALDR